MASSLGPLDHESAEEKENLISYPHDEEKDQDSDKPFYHRQKRCIPSTRASYITLLAIIVLMSSLLSGLALLFLHIVGPQHSRNSAPGTRFGSCGDTHPQLAAQVAHSISCRSRGSQRHAQIQSSQQNS
jgi:hypothetical protein